MATKSNTTPKVKRSTKVIGKGESRSTIGGEFSIKVETTKTPNDGDRRKFIIVGAAGFENPFNTANEVVNFCLAVFKRKIDISALRAGELEFLDDGKVSRSEKAKLSVAFGRLESAINSVNSARAVFMKGDLTEGSTNMKMIEAMNGIEAPIIDMCQLIKDTVTPPKPDPTIKDIKDADDAVKKGKEINDSSTDDAPM